QRGINVLVTLFDPEGKQIVEMDGEGSTQGQEEVLFIAAASGSYRLEVRSPEKRVKAGKYEVKIEELREATRKDTDRIAAQTIFLDGFKLTSQGKAEPLREAAKKYERSLEEWRALGETHRAAVTLNRLGELYYHLGERKRALECDLQELSFREAIGDRGMMAETLTSIGVAYISLGDYRKALAYLNQALP